ncbi:MAG: hypothetical protein AAB438_00430 [Patescibacteria group bacterium]
MKNIKFLAVFSFILLVTFVPFLSEAQGGIVTCFSNCGYNEFIKLINKIVNIILFQIAVPIAAIMFTYAGFKLIFSGGDHHAMEQAKHLFVSVVKGLVLAAAAWLIIHTILSTLGYDGSWVGF